MSKLKDCPFCNSDNIHPRYDGINKHFIVCKNCGSETAAMTSAKAAVDYWNTRWDIIKNTDNKNTQLNNDLDEQRLELIKTILPALIAKGLDIKLGMLADTYSDNNKFVEDGYGRKTNKRQQPAEHWYVDEAIKYADAALIKLGYK